MKLIMKIVILSDTAGDNPPGFVWVCSKVECAVIDTVNPSKRFLLAEIKRGEEGE